MCDFRVTLNIIILTIIHLLIADLIKSSNNLSVIFPLYDDHYISFESCACDILDNREYATDDDVIRSAFLGSW